MSPDDRARRSQRGDAPKGDVARHRPARRHPGGQADRGADPARPPAAAHLRRRRGARRRRGGLVELVAEARTVGQTGVEMEAMTAAAVAALTVYDMVKGIERGVAIEAVVLLEKSGGRSGTWRARRLGDAEPAEAERARRAPHRLDLAGSGRGRGRERRRSSPSSRAGSAPRSPAGRSSPTTGS